MQRIALTIVSILCLHSQLGAAEQPVRVTIHQLLATPEKFHGRRVAVTGYHNTSPEESSLFASERDAREHWDPANSIWLDSTTFHPARSDSLDHRVVHVIGTFRYEPRPILGKSVPYAQRYRGFGSYRMWARAINDITYFERAK